MHKNIQTVLKNSSQRIRSCADGVSQNTDHDRCKSICKNCGRLILSALQPVARAECDKMIANCVSHYQAAHFDKQMKQTIMSDNTTLRISSTGLSNDADWKHLSTFVWQNE